jgi:N utilization substance protein B
VLALGSRRSARERALSLLYEADLKDEPVSMVLAELPVPPQRYATEIVAGVEEHAGQIDALIARHAIDWSLERMPVVDRAILRMATFELGWRPDVPTSVVISEAVRPWSLPRRTRRGSRAALSMGCSLLFPASCARRSISSALDREAGPVRPARERGEVIGQA